MPVKIYTPGKEQGYNYWLNIMAFDDVRLTGKFIRAMHQSAIEVKHTWFPLHLMPLFKKFPYFGNNETAAFFQKNVLLPSGAGLTDEDLQYIIEQTAVFFEKH
jgi:dTDP-4-amino-4,6-dideoxygalactose transaminase